MLCNCYCVRAKRERTLVLAGLPVAIVRSQGCFQKFGFLVSFWHPRRFSQGLDSREQPTGYVWPCGYVQARTGFGVRPAQQRPFDLVFCSLLFWCGLVVLSLGNFSSYLKVSSCTRYWQCGRRILNILLVMCFYQIFSSFTPKLLPCFAMDGRHSRSDIDRRRCHVGESL